MTIAYIAVQISATGNGENWSANLPPTWDRIEVHDAPPPHVLFQRIQPIGQLGTFEPRLRRCRCEIARKPRIDRAATLVVKYSLLKVDSAFDCIEREPGGTRSRSCFLYNLLGRRERRARGDDYESDVAH